MRLCYLRAFYITHTGGFCLGLGAVYTSLKFAINSSIVRWVIELEVIENVIGTMFFVKFLFRKLIGPSLFSKFPW